ncbi:MAG: ADP-glyceromanno-heptose 6-epimerase [Candidatus Fluviicola riflensis]|nr:MAG: ADP-glyceromanno-heptose 6-epimerase [Candidatus Fluviicola riflensis]OGS77545.1 MAG: ADP-glyceromanno-heptose 6-epimerase [Candidatus Fluviicola riflensis]OGS84126.1 MAG: ADP-glyceromanno-heptose 6-epimerase [Fluviicola sp. RIFCSPHIGHO2_12_FULL_43_24]OGS84611.1 MAG: ADP-glyceromanno-heptose 6-epimerase [Fluviicola sp. RIFCSPHIGHO2_01_FULL_43_53]
MIVITGAAGFIGSCLVSELNNNGITDLVLVDDFTKSEKSDNLKGKYYTELVERSVFDQWFQSNGEKVSFVYHIGARTDTTEFDKAIFDELNVDYSKMIWKHCVAFNIPLVYASSGATYGLGEIGYDDNEATIPQLQPLNPYGWSKQWFDIWALEQTATPPFWAGLKFFNVYGPNEYHKGRMASVIFHAFNQIQATGGMKLFRSHNPNYDDGGQMRDFVYVKDVVSVCQFLREGKAKSGIYNLGSGVARPFLDLAVNTFKALGKEPNISFIDTPEDIRDKYQYFTEANMAKLISQGYDKPFHSLEEGVTDYVKNYLLEHKYF